jgi:hypothetical protein
MVAYKNLLEKDRSLIEAGGTADLMANREIADNIFASLAAGDGEWVLKEGVDADEAYAALIQALGYYYVGEDGNTWNLYADSALEYIDNDRPDNQNNQAKVNTANANLEAAIANFKTIANYTVTYTDGVEDEEVFADEVYTVKDGTATPEFQGSTDREGYEFSGWTPQIADTVTDNVTYTAMWEEVALEPNTLIIKDGANVEAFIDTVNCFEYTGLVYGIDTLGLIEEDGAIADNLTTAYGDDYLEIEALDTETTGTVLNVLGEDGEVVETYIFVYFGDVDMDSEVTINDAFIAEYFEVYGEGVDNYYQLVAADVDMDNEITINDGFVMEYFEVYGEGMGTQQEIGATVSTNVYEF